MWGSLPSLAFFRRPGGPQGQLEYNGKLPDFDNSRSEDIESDDMGNFGKLHIYKTAETIQCGRSHTLREPEILQSSLCSQRVSLVTGEFGPRVLGSLERPSCTYATRQSRSNIAGTERYVSQKYY